MIIGNHFGVFSFSNHPASPAALLNFHTPHGLRMTLSSLATPRFATSYELGSTPVFSSSTSPTSSASSSSSASNNNNSNSNNASSATGDGPSSAPVGGAAAAAVDGSVAYLYATVPLGPPAAVADSSSTPLPDLLRGYRQVGDLRRFSSSGAAEGRAARRRRTKTPPKREAAVGDDDDADAGAWSWRALVPTRRPRDASGGGSPPEFASALKRQRPTLLYGRMYLPASQLEALVVRRVAPRLQVQASAVSARDLRNGGTVLGLVQYDAGRFGLEGLASSDGGLLGLRGLYNFGGDAADLDNGVSLEDTAAVLRGGLAAAPAPPAQAAAAATAATPATDEDGSVPTAEDASRNRTSPTPSPTPTPTPTATNVPPPEQRERIYGRFSTGAELYYGTLNKSGGMSVGARFTTLPDYGGTPLTATLTLNPLMGSVAAGYAVAAGRHCALATKLEFNVYSYESAWAVGMELWRKGLGGGREARAAWGTAVEGQTESLGWGRTVLQTEDTEKGTQRRERSFKAKMAWRLDGVPAVAASTAGTNGSAGVDGAKGIAEADGEDQYTGVVKARLDQNFRIGLMWEGRVQSLIFSLGSAIDLRRADQPFRSLGLEVQFSS